MAATGSASQSPVDKVAVRRFYTFAFPAGFYFHFPHAGKADVDKPRAPPFFIIMGSSQSVVTAMEAVLKQRDIKIANRTLKNFVKEVDRVAPWYACSGSLTLASWNKLGRDLVRRMEEVFLRKSRIACQKLNTVRG